MLILSFIIGLGILIVMIYLALSKKTSNTTRIAALIALGLMVLAIVVSLVLIFFGGSLVRVTEIVPDPEAPLTQAQPQASGDSLLIVVCIVFLLALFVLVMIFSLKESRKKSQTPSF